MSQIMKFGRLSVRITQCAVLVLLTVLALPAYAEVRLPNGEWVESVEDLRVKVLGGYVVAQRTWQAEQVKDGEYRWLLNPAWDDLRFEYDLLDGSVKTVRRAGARFERTGDAEPTYVFDRQFFIREELDAQGDRTGWRWYDRKGSWITYAADGRITAYGDRSDATVSFTRDNEDRLHQVLDHYGDPALTYTYTGSATTLTDRAGRTVVYHYSGGQLTQVTDVVGNPWSYEYSGGLMSAKIDAEGRRTQITYSGNRVVAVTGPPEDGSTFVTTYEYDFNRIKREYTIVQRTPEQRRIERVYDANGKLLRQDTGDRTTFRLERDGIHIEHRIDERGLRTTTEYDAHRNPIRMRYPDGTQVHMVYDPVHNQLIERTDELGVKTAYTYNASGRVLSQTEAVDTPVQRITEFTYDGLGRRLSRTIKGAAPAEDATTTWTYDAHGNVQTETNPESQTTTYDNYHVSGQPGTLTDARQHTTTFIYDDAGRLTSITNPLNHSVGFEYDKVGNRTKSIDAKANQTVTTYSTHNWLKTETDPEGGVTVYDYDRDGNRIQETDAEDVQIQYEFDLDGRLWRIIDGAGNVTEYVYGSQQVGTPGQLHQVIYPTYREEYRYDQRNRRTQSIRILPAENGDPERRETTVTSYDARGRLLSVTDPMNRITVNAYDARGRLLTTTDPGGGITGHGYDTRDNLTSVTDANQNTHTFDYDKADRMTREARPMGQGIDFEYDEVGNLTLRTSANGERREYVYDQANRRTHEHYYAAGETETSQSIVYHHDERGLLTGYAQSGDTDSAALYVYNDRGEKTQETVTYGQAPTAFSKTIDYAYYDNSRVSGFTYPDGTVIAYAYDEAGRLTRITTPAGPIDYTTYQWQQPTRVELPGAVRTHAYDALQRPKQITVQALGGGDHHHPAGDIHLDLHYTYNAAGNIIEKASLDGPYLYDYDALDRLTQAIPPEQLQASVGNPTGLPIEAYSYDPVHNRMASAHQPGPWQYNQNNELEGWGEGAEAVIYQYDANGHTILETKAGEVTEYVYNAAERLSEVKRNGALIATYHYDPMGRRISKTVSGLTIWFQYSDQGLIAEYSATGNLTRTYGWSPQGLWGTDPVFLGDVSGAQAGMWSLHNYHNDHLGTPKRTTDAQGQQSWVAISEAFGRTIVASNSVIANPWRFPGQYFDAESRLHYNFFRSYDAKLGRYLQFDPMGLVDGSNAHSYVKGNPNRSIDFDGRYSRIIDEYRPERTLCKLLGRGCPASPEFPKVGRCQVICNLVPGMVCTAAAGGASRLGGFGAAAGAWTVCNAGKMYICKKICDPDPETCGGGGGR